MVTLSLQMAVALLTLAFGAGALAVFRGGGHATEERRAFWLLAGTAFLLSGANGVLSGAVAAWGFLAGRGSAPWDFAIQVKMVGNDGRALLMLGWAATTLLWVARRRPGTAAPGRVALLFLPWLLAGSVLGLLEKPLMERHYPLVAALSASAMMLLLAALLLAVVRDAMDWLLWSALVVYALREAMEANLVSVLSWLGVPGAWTPSARSLQMLAICAYLVMLACVARRRAIARSGATVPSLFELGGPAPRLPAHPHGRGP